MCIKKLWEPFSRFAPKMLFGVQIALVTISVIASAAWLFFGKQYFLICRWLWNIIERGSLDAVMEVMSIVGIGSVLLGWMGSGYSDTTLGKSQSEIIEYKFSRGYAVSLITHFGATALCILMSMCGAKGPAFWSFISVVFGCLPQALVFLQITINENQRERIAIKIWLEKDNENCTDVIGKMISLLSDVSIRNNQDYCDALCQTTVKWINNSQGCEIESRIKTLSDFLEAILGNASGPEKVVFERRILGNICKYIPEDWNKNDAGTLLSSAYANYLYRTYNSDMKNYVNGLHGFFDVSGNSGKFINLVGAFSLGLEWFFFLRQMGSLPRNGKVCIGKNAIAGTYFRKLVSSISGSNNTLDHSARVAWNQVNFYSEVKSHADEEFGVPTAVCSG